MRTFSGWAPFDPRHFNAVLQIPEMAEILICVYNADTKHLKSELLTDAVTKLGLLDPGNRYHEITFAFDGAEFSLQFGQEDDRFVYKITPLVSKPYVKFYICGLYRWAAKGSLSVYDGHIRFLTAGGREFLIGIDGEPCDVPVNAYHQGLLYSSEEPVYIRCNHTMTPGEMDDFLDRRRRESAATQLTGGGWLADAPEAAVRGILWNTMYDNIHDRMIPVVTRDWIAGIFEKNTVGGTMIYTWDNFFAALIEGMADKEFAYQNIAAILDEALPNGLVPNNIFEIYKSQDRSGVPVGAYCVLKLYTQYRDQSLLQNSFPRLRGWILWLRDNRIRTESGLLELGSDPYPSDQYGLRDADGSFGTLRGAKNESGLDNSPMYDDAEYDETTHTMKLADIGFNSLYALSLWSLSVMAGELGDVEEKQRLEAEYEEIKARINETMWDEAAGIYCNRYRGGRLSNRYTPTSFYPLLAGIATPERAKRMIESHLLNEAEFWGEYVIPSISKSDSAFYEENGVPCPNGGYWPPGGYWRGRIWGPMNFLVCEGLKRVGFDDIALSFAQKSHAVFMKEWVEKNHIHENYNALTAEGCDQNYSQPFYTWGGLLAYIAVCEVADALPWSGIKFGSWSGAGASVRNILFQGGRYEIRSGRNLNIVKDNRLLL